MRERVERGCEGVGSEGRRVVWQARGTERQVRQRRRWRPEESAGVFAVQFCALPHTLDHGGRSSSVGETRSALLTLHMTVPQRLHSATMSRAHLPTLPLVILGPGHSFATRLVLLRHVACDSRCLSAGASPGWTSSLEQRSDWVTSWSRNWSRFTRNWRHVRERLWRVLRSRRLAS